MTSLPGCIKTYVLKWFARHYTIGFLIVDKRGMVESWGGALHELGFTQLKQGCPAEEQVCFLTGVLPLNEPTLLMPLYKTKTQRSVDIHIFRTDMGHGVLLMDQTEYAGRLAELQQKANDMALRIERSGF